MALEEISGYDLSGVAEEDTHIYDIATMDLGKPLKKKQKVLTGAMNATRVRDYERKYVGEDVVRNAYWKSQLHGHAGRLCNISTISPLNRLSEEATINFWRLLLMADREAEKGDCPLCEAPLRDDKFHALGCDGVATNQNRHARMASAMRVSSLQPASTRHGCGGQRTPLGLVLQQEPPRESHARQAANGRQSGHPAG